MQAQKQTNVVALKPKAATDRQVSDALAASSRTAEKHQAEIRKAFRHYREAGWKPILLYKGRKRPVGNDWLERAAPEEDDFVGHANIGRANGAVSNGHIDIDIDCEELLPFASFFLPPTTARFGRYYGRDTQSLSHYLYHCPDFDKSFVLKLGGKTLIEIRANGGQTVFPPSLIYDDNLRDLDLVCWDGGPKASPPVISDIPTVSAEFIKAQVSLYTVSVLVASHFKQGGFHDGMLSWAGMLAKAGYSEEDTVKTTVWIAQQSGQRDIQDRLNGVVTTYKRVVDGEEVIDPNTGEEKRASGVSWFKENISDKDLVSLIYRVFRVKSVVEDDGRPMVRVVASKETQLYDDTLNAMIATKKFYSLGGQIVVINKENMGNGVFNARMTPLADSISMGSWLTREILFVQSTLDKVAMQYVDQIIKAPTAVATELSNIATYRGNMPQINGISNIPTITRSGRIVDDHWGYDEELRTFFACRFNVRKMHPDEALNVLREPFVDFPFTAGLSDSVSTEVAAFGEKFGRYHAAAISAILAAVVRSCIDICPMYLITSSLYGDGKSVMSNAIAAAVGMEGGSPNSPLTRGGSDEEQEKQISSVLARGKRVVVYDNHDGEFRSAALTETLTSSMPEFRVLGKSEVRTVPNRSMFITNGVNTVLATDLQTRSVVIRLERRDIDPHRKFKHLDVVDWCYQNSESLVSAAVSLIDWALKQDNGSWVPTHRFKDWDLLVRRTLLLACGVDISPPLSEDMDRAMDPVEEIKNQILPWIKSKWDSGLRASGKKNFFRAKTLSEEIRPDSDEEGWINVLSKRPNAQMEQKVGKCLAALCGVPFESGDKVYVLKRYIVDKISAYAVECVE